MIGETLRMLRQEKKLKQEEVSKILAMKRASYSCYETNKREPDFATICKIADLYNVSVDFILGRTAQRVCVTIEKDNVFNLITNKENELIKQYRKLDSRDKYAVTKLVETLASNQDMTVSKITEKKLKF